MSKARTLQDWIDTHIGGDCAEASDCVILLAQVMKKELDKVKPSITESGE